MFELFDCELLIGDNSFDHIADRNDADELLMFENREMAHGLRGHDGHAFLNRLIKSRTDDSRRHDFADQSPWRRSSFQDYLSRVIALGDYADESAAVQHDQCPYVALRHDRERVEDGGVWMNVVNAVALLIEHVSYSGHLTSSLRWLGTARAPG